MSDFYSLDLESGSSQYAYVADNVPLSVTGDLTIEALVKFESLPSSGGSMAIAGKFATDQYGYLLRMDESSGLYLLRLLYSNNGTTVVWNQATWAGPTVGLWYHIAAATTISAHSTEFFIDANSIGTGTDATHTSIADTSAQFQIGASAGASPTAYFDGLINEVRVWNDVRTQQEIQNNMYQLYHSEPNLVGHWKLENNYADSSGNGSTLTASGGPVFVDDVPPKPFSNARRIVVGNGMGQIDVAS